jgi:hypothetical protein
MFKRGIGVPALLIISLILVFSAASTGVVIYSIAQNITVQSIVTQTHLACINNQCVVVNGSGQNQCQTPQTNCVPPANTYLSCVNQQCTRVQGSGTNSCSPEASLCDINSTILERATCSNGIDDDNDGWIDLLDPGCSFPEDSDEFNGATVFACSNGIDDDNDTLIDGKDSGCANWQDNNETLSVIDFFACSNGIDDDNDGFIDYPLDAGCSSLEDNTETGEELNRMTTYAYAWSNKDTNHFNNLIPIYWIASYNLSSQDPQKIKSQTEQMPEGNRVIASWDIHRTLDENTEDRCRTSTNELTQYSCPWWDNGAQEVAGKFNTLFENYKNAGGKIDFFILDYEQITGGICIHNWCIGAYPSASAQNNYLAIQNDPRFPQMSNVLGFNNLLNVWHWQTIQSNPNAVPYYIIWNRYADKLASTYINQATYNVIKSHFPNVKGSDWAYHYHKLKYPLVNLHGHNLSYCSQGLYCGEGTHVGSHQSPAPQIHGFGFELDSKKLDGINNYVRTPFNMMRFSVNVMKISRLSNSNVPLAPWFSSRSWQGDNIQLKYLVNDDFYQEAIMHSLLSGATNILYWNPKNSFPGGAENGISYIEDNQILSNTLKEFDSLAGFNNKQSLINDNENNNYYEINEITWWGDDYVLTGMRAENRRIWRFTPSQTTNLVPLIENNLTLTLQTSQKTIVFPQGRVWRPSNPASSRGLWIVQPSSADLPTITTN